jgi:predicted nuclease with TOPRIM domain
VNVDATTLTAALSAVVALGTTGVAYLKRTDDGMARRIDQAMNANQALVDDLQAERSDLVERLNKLGQRVEGLEADRDSLTKEVGRLRDIATQQAREMYWLRTNESELRTWATDVIVPWIAAAVAAIRELGGGDYSQPPPPPARRDF